MPTRWTVKAEALKSIVDNFEVLQNLWEESLEYVKESEMRARIGGVSDGMMKFDFLWCNAWPNSRAKLFCPTVII